MMANKKVFQWGHLEQLRHHTNITNMDHHTRDSSYIYEQMCMSRAKWRAYKKECETKTPIPGGMCYFLCFQIVMLRGKGTLSYTKSQRFIKDIEQY
jgi:hypothetical protein